MSAAERELLLAERPVHIDVELVADVAGADTYVRGLRTTDDIVYRIPDA